MAEKHILIIDDEGDFRAILTHVLKEGGFKVSEASDGAEGIEAFAKDRPDLVLLDITMPGMDGIEVCRRLKQQVPDGLPILLVTARSQLATAAEGLQAGASDYILKPFDPEDLLRRVRQALGV